MATKKTPKKLGDYEAKPPAGLTPAKAAAAAKVTKAVAKAAVPKKAKLAGPPLPTVLPKGKMTEKKLAALRDKKGVVRFLLKYPFASLTDGTVRTDTMYRDAEAAACPSPAFELDGATFRLYGSAGQAVVVLVATKVAAAGVKVPPPGPAPAETAVQPETAVQLETAVTPGTADPATPCGEVAVPADPPVAVSATVESDDKRVTAAFDATPWFAEAGDQDVLALAREEFGHDFTADAVAEFVADSVPEVRAVLGYVADLKAKNTDHPDAGFGCVVDRAQARAWVAANRPAILAEFDAICATHPPA